MTRKNKNELIMDAVNRIYNTNDEGLLAFCVKEEMESDTESYQKMGSYIVYLFKKYSEEAEILEEMLIAICGWGIGSLQQIMEEQRLNYENL